MLRRLTVADYNFAWKALDEKAPMRDLARDAISARIKR